MSNLMFLWIFIIFAGIIIDIITSNILFVSFSVGALTAVIMQLINLPPVWQIIVFLLIGNTSFAVSYFYIRKHIKNIPQVSPYEKTFIGRTIKLINDIDTEGQVMLEGTYWIAITKEPLKAGDTAEIIGIKGNKLLIKRKE